VMKFGVLMPVGPGDGEIAADVMRALAFYYPQFRVFPVDDHTSDGTYEHLLEAAQSTGARVLRNPTAGGWANLINGNAWAAKQIMDEWREMDALIRLDADVAITNPGLDTMFEACFAEGPGIAGHYRRDDLGKERRWRHMARKVLMDGLPVGLARAGARAGWRRWNRLRVGRPPYWKFMHLARKNGYQWAENVFGPCYAIHVETLRRMREAGYLDSIERPFAAALIEDELLISLGAYVVGHRLIEAARPPFEHVMHLRYTTGPTIPVEQIIHSGVAVVHALKGRNSEMAAVREELVRTRNKREAAAL
jgi:glycosyltransferase involved in cell wall biosynthesis